MADKGVQRGGLVVCRAHDVELWLLFGVFSAGYWDHVWGGYVASIGEFMPASTFVSEMH